MSNFSTILHKRNSTAGVVPNPSSLSAGEIAINTADAKLFVKTTENAVESFLNASQQPFVLNSSLSSVNSQYGDNSVTGILAAALGGISNDVSGAGSTVVNGSDNTVAGDYALIGNGSNNTITADGDFGAILGGQNNTLNHQDSFILGSDITSHSSNFTYVNNLSSLGKIYSDNLSVKTLSTERFEVVGVSSDVSVLYTSVDGKVGINTESPNHELTVIGSISATNKIYGDGSELTGIVAGDVEATTLVRSNSASWDSTYTTVQSNSSANWNNSVANQYTHTNFLPLTGGNLTGGLTTTSTISSSQTISASGARVITGLPSDSAPVYYITVLTQGEYDVIASPNANTLYFIKP